MACFRGWTRRSTGAAATKNGGDPEGDRCRPVRCASTSKRRRCRLSVVLAEDDHFVLCDREVRARNGHNRIHDRPPGAPSTSTSNLLCRGSGVGGRRGCSQIIDRAAAVVVSVAEVLLSEPRLRRHRILAGGQMTFRVRAVIVNRSRDLRMAIAGTLPSPLKLPPNKVTDAASGFPKSATGSLFTLTAASALEDVRARANSAAPVSNRNSSLGPGRSEGR